MMIEAAPKSGQPATVSFVVPSRLLAEVDSPYSGWQGSKKATVEGSLPLKMQRRSNFWTIYAV
jgi:hypothetical protein